MLSSSRAIDPLLPGFHARSKLVVARDIAVILVCLALLVGFIAEIWSAPAARRPAAPEPTPRPRSPVAMVVPPSAV